jgi:hypothetical protein
MVRYNNGCSTTIQSTHGSCRSHEACTGQPHRFDRAGLLAGSAPVAAATGGLCGWAHPAAATLGPWIGVGLLAVGIVLGFTYQQARSLGGPGLRVVERSGGGLLA